jgi:hypothetical protein
LDLLELPSGWFPMTDEQRRTYLALVTVVLRGDDRLCERLLPEAGKFELEAALLVATRVIGQAKVERVCPTCLWSERLLAAEGTS